MPAIQQTKQNVANKLSPQAMAARGSKRLATVTVKKKKKLVKFQQKSNLLKNTQQPEQYHVYQGSHFSQAEWDNFIVGNCPQHGKSEQGWLISGKRWYWCNNCKRYSSNHNTSTCQG